MYLTRHETPLGPRWAVDGEFLPPSFELSLLLELPKEAVEPFLATMRTGEPAEGELLAPIEPAQEVWASGVTYLRSRDARQAESESGDIYARVYLAERPELFLKAVGWRVVGHQADIRVRPDSSWNVPEPELTLVINSRGEVVGFCAGNDVSSRSIEGANPLYLPQAKVYAGSCALGPGIQIAEADDLRALPIKLQILRDDVLTYEGDIDTGQMKRSFEGLVSYLYSQLDFPRGAFLMTGTGIVPPDDFSLQGGDVVRIGVGDLTLINAVAPE
ncbi:MAG: fumarylacetoacetate hydrolase family protein [Anaerolineae bacterium]